MSLSCPARAARAWLALLAALSLTTLSPGTWAAPAGAAAPDTADGFSSTDVMLLRAQMRAALGGERLDQIAGVRLSGRYELGGLPGHFEQTQDFRAGRDVLRYDVGVTRGGQASGAHFSWWVDEKGLVNYDDTPEVLAEAATESYLDRNGFLYSEPAAHATYQGVQQQAGRAFDVLRVQPPGGRLLTLWVDRATHLVDHIIEHDVEQEDDTTYFSDWRRVQGLEFPFRQRESTGDPRTDAILEVRSLRWLTHIDAAAFDAPRSRIADVRLPHGVSSVTLPFTLRDGMILLPVSIDGAAPLPFALDSGGMNSFTPAAAAKLGVAPRGNFALNGVGARLVDAQLAPVAQMRLGAATLLNQPFLVVSLPTSLTYRGSEPPIAGLIGYELFRRFQVTVDYHARQLTLSAPGTPASGARLPLLFEGRRPFVLASIDGTSGYFGVDTGDDGAITLFHHFYDAHEFPIELPGIDSGQGGVGGYVPTLLTRVASFAIGPLTLAHPLAELNFANAGAFASDFSAGNLGAQLLQNFVVTLDYADHALYLKPAPEFGRDMAYNRSGAQFDVDGDGLLEVSAVSPGTPGAVAGLQRGDRLLAINGQRQRGQDYSSEQGHFRAPAGTALLLQVLRDGRRLVLSMTLGEPLPPQGCCAARLGQPPQSVSRDRDAAAMH